MVDDVPSETDLHRGRDMASRPIPAFLIEYFLLGRTRVGAIEQFYQDGGVTTDVWMAFAADPQKPVRVLIAPLDGYASAELGFALHSAIQHYRERAGIAGRHPPGVSPLEDYVVANVHLDELLHVLLPLTGFFYRNRLDQLAGDEALRPHTSFLEREIHRRLGVAIEREPDEAAEQLATSPVDAAGPQTPTHQALTRLRVDHERRRGVIAAAPVAALIGLVEAWDEITDPDHHPADGEAGIAWIDPQTPAGREYWTGWVRERAATIASAAVEALTRPRTLREADLCPPGGGEIRQLADDEGRLSPIIKRVFIDRQARLSHREAICTVKADAAQLLFEISCKEISWAIIDSGVAARHPAFIDHKRGQRLRPGQQAPTRVRGTFDFTMITEIRNFDLLDGGDGAIARLVEKLAALPVRRKTNRPFAEAATQALKDIASQLKLGLRPDWRLIEPLIALEPDDGSSLGSDHGTHVAGTLGGDWREADGAPRLRGICPDINLYDLRVIPYPGHGPDGQDEQLFATESAVLAALEFIQHLNSRSMVRTQIIHGVNISMSIPHDVRNYGCGATPICVACDRLVNSGVVVVAAAGNRGWNQEDAIGFGNYVYCSITDPGNAREVITVGSTHRNKPHVYGVSYFSSRGPTGDGRLKPDLIAPGEAIRAPIRNDAEGELSGTSMAAPFVSGGAAMVMARHPEMIGKPLEVKAALLESATDLQRERYFQGHGLLDVLRAIQSR